MKRKGFQRSIPLKFVLQDKISNKKTPSFRSETDTSVICKNVSFMSMIFLNLFSNITFSVDSLAFPLTNISKRFWISQMHSSSNFTFRVKNAKATLAFHSQLIFFKSYQLYPYNYTFWLLKHSHFPFFPTILINIDSRLNHNQYCQNFSISFFYSLNTHMCKSMKF